MVYDRVWDKDKFLNENFCLERPCFHTTNHLRIEANPGIICSSRKLHEKRDDAIFSEPEMI